MKPLPLPPPELTPDEATEWNYVLRERLGIACEDGHPTMNMVKRAVQSANIATGVQTQEDLF